MSDAISFPLVYSNRPMGSMTLTRDGGYIDLCVNDDHFHRSKTFVLPMSAAMELRDMLLDPMGMLYVPAQGHIAFSESADAFVMAFDTQDADGNTAVTVPWHYEWAMLVYNALADVCSAAEVQS